MGKKLSRAEKKAENERAIAEMEDAMREAGTPLGNVGKATPALSKDKTEGAGESRAQKDGGGFSAAGGPDDRDEFPFRYGKIQIFHGDRLSLPGVVVHGYVFKS